MTGRPKIEIPQLWMPGLDGSDVGLTLHMIGGRSFGQRISLQRRSPRQTLTRRIDIVLTRDQMYDLVGELDERAGLMTFEIPERKAT